jgi:hypothetical protein
MRGARTILAAKCDLKNLAIMDDCAHSTFWRRRIRFVQIDLTKLGRIVLGRTRSKGRYIEKLITKRLIAGGNKVLIFDRLLRAGCAFRRAYGLDEQGNDDLQMLVDVVKKRFKVDYTQFTTALCSPP